MSKPLDKIYIRDLSIRCIIGIFPEERTKRQDVLINVVMHADLAKAGQTDSIDDTVDYKRITKAIIAAIDFLAFMGRAERGPLNQPEEFCCSRV